MSALEVPPLRTNIQEKNGVVNGIWQKWFERLWSNSAAIPQPWTPVFDGLTGSHTVTGTYTKVGGLMIYNVLLTPDTTTDSVLGTTRIINMPLQAASFGSLTAINTSSRVVLGTGQADLNTNSAWTPTWVAVANPISINGFVQVAP